MEITPELIELDKAGRIIAEHLQDSITQMKVYDSMALFESIRWNVVGDAIHILYNYYGMFPDMGVGKGIPISEVAMMRGSGGRRAKKWYSPVIYREVARLAEKVAKLTGIRATATILPEGQVGMGADIVAMAI